MPKQPWRSTLINRFAGVTIEGRQLRVDWDIGRDKKDQVRQVRHPDGESRGPPPRRDFDNRREYDSRGYPPPRRDYDMPPRHYDRGMPPPRDFNDRRGGFNERPPPRDFNERPPPRDFNERPPPRDFEERPPPRDYDYPPKETRTYY